MRTVYVPEFCDGCYDEVDGLVQQAGCIESVYDEGEIGVEDEGCCWRCGDVISTEAQQHEN